MARAPKMSKRRGRDYYSTKKNGVEYNLGTDKTEATKEFYRIWGRDDAPSRNPMVVDLVDSYQQWSKANHSPGSHNRIKASLDSFASTLPAGIRVNKLLPAHLSKWIEVRCPKQPKDDSKPVSDNTRRNYLGDVLGAFTWAASTEQKIIPYSPFHGYRKPPKTPRAVCLTGDQWEVLMAEVDADDPFRDFLLVLRNTGCRPQEGRVMEARHIDFKRKVAHFEKNEVPGKPWERDILLNNNAVAILQKWALKYPAGPVLRNTRGRPWSKDALNSRFQRLKLKLPFKAHCYAARHSLATDMLDSGASAGAVAAVLGHRDPTMVLKVYGKHIENREKHLRDCLTKATKKVRLA